MLPVSRIVLCFCLCLYVHATAVYIQAFLLYLYTYTYPPPATFYYRQCSSDNTLWCTHTIVDIITIMTTILLRYGYKLVIVIIYTSAVESTFEDC